MIPRYRLEHVVRRYHPLRSRSLVEALRVPYLEVAPGEILAVVGPNGSGKSTLLETMAFLGKPDEGRIVLDGCDIWAEGNVLSARRRCPMLLQRTVLFKTSVLKNVMYGLLARGMSRADARRKAEKVLRLVRLEKLRDRTHRELSGGEKQRVALARILTLNPEVLLLDEPTTYVDHANAMIIETVIRELHETTGLTVVIASHNVRQALSLADRVVTLLDGQLFPGTLDNLFEGTLHKNKDCFEFRGISGLCLQLPDVAIHDKEGHRLTDSLNEPVRITLNPARIEVLATNEASTGLLPGQIEAINREKDQCRITVRLETSEHIYITLPLSDYERLGLNIGRGVRLRIAEQALRVLR